MSNKPTFKLELKQKDGDRKLDICGMWPGKKAGQYSAGKAGFSVYDPEEKKRVAVAKLVLEDGRSIPMSEYWVNGFHFGEYYQDKDRGGRKPQQYEGYDQGGPVDDEDLPF